MVLIPDMVDSFVTCENKTTTFTKFLDNKDPLVSNTRKQIRYRFGFTKDTRVIIKRKIKGTRKEYCQQPSLSLKILEISVLGWHLAGSGEWPFLAKQDTL